MSRAAILALALLAGCGPRDDSDPPGGRSGFSVYRDNLTGCEYIGWDTLWGKAITPRMGVDGRQVCRSQP